MIKISLSKGYVALVDDEDADLASFKWSAALRRNTVYGVRRNGNKYAYLHREVFGRKQPNWDGTGEVDHKDNDGLNCRRDNVRQATRSQNGKNLRKRAKSKHKGVSWYARQQKWRARIKVNYESVHLGYFSTAEEAAAAYDAASRQYHGEFGHSNTKDHHARP